MSLVQPLEIGASASPARRRGPLRPVALAPVRRRIEPRGYARLFSALDRVVLALGALLALTNTGDVLGITIRAALPLIAGVLLIHTVARRSFYGFPRGLSRLGHLARIGSLAAAATLLTGVMALGLGQPVRLSMAGMAATGAALCVVHLGWWTLVRRWRAAGRLTPNVVVVGATPNAERLIEAALASRDIAILGVFDDRAARSPDAVGGVPVLGDTNALLNHPLLPFVDRIVITVPAYAQARVRTLIDRLRVLPNSVTLFMDHDGAEERAATVARLARISLTHVSGMEADERRAFEKRVQDLLLGGVGFVLSLPLLAIIAVLVKLDSPGPALFRQRRHGFNNEVITVWKFRSMRAEAADHTAARQVSRNDDRVTRVGRVIRKLSLDELPQLINVLKGEMSLVGPRPHAIGMRTGGEESARLVAEYAWRHRMKPGLTGWAQINGSIGAVDTPEAVRRRVALDVEYIENQSLWLDLYIILMTVPALIRSRNVVR